MYLSKYVLDMYAISYTLDVAVRHIYAYVAM